MLIIKTTPNLFGISLQGDYQDLNELYDSLSRYLDFYIENSLSTPYHEYEYLLSLNYDIRHAYEGRREIELVDNNADFIDDDLDSLYWVTEEELPKYKHVKKHYQKGNLYFKVDILYPMIFHYIVAFETILDEYMLPDEKHKKPDYLENYSIIDANRDRAQIEHFVTLLWANLETLFSVEETAIVFQAFMYEDYHTIPASIYTNALVHWQMAHYEDLTENEKKCFLMASLLEMTEIDLKKKKKDKQRPSSFDLFFAAKAGLESCEYPFPYQNTFFTKLEKEFSPDYALNENDYDRFLEKYYGKITNEYEEFDW